MPELVEVEAYRALAARLALGRPVAAVEAPDAWYLKRGLDAEVVGGALVGRDLVAARRVGKLLLVDTAGGPTLGLRFGMTGRLVVDGRAGVDDLLYAPHRAEAAWERFGLRFADGGRLVMVDPRRLGGVELDPDEVALGPDAAGIGPAALRRALAGTTVALKARLLDQSRLAGVGNLIADEALWRAGLAPGRAAGGLSAAEVRRLRTHLLATVADLTERGGSHTGELLPARHPGGRCPRDGVELVRDRIGGRTTWWCPVHQL